MAIRYLNLETDEYVTRAWQERIKQDPKVKISDVIADLIRGRDWRNELD